MRLSEWGSSDIWAIETYRVRKMRDGYFVIELVYIYYVCVCGGGGVIELVNFITELINVSPTKLIIINYYYGNNIIVTYYLNDITI